MKLLLSLDYELFFGTPTGTVAACMLEPTDAILRLAASSGMKIVLFVDATFLMRLREESGKHRGLGDDWDRIRRQLARAVRDGNDVQLHTHPHWMDSRYDGREWQLSLGRYRLQDFDEDDRRRIVGDSRRILEEAAGSSVFAFRAGGWCVQPFPGIRSALREAGIWLDSTVYAGGVSRDPGREYDFRGAPEKPHWRFSDDPGEEAETGEFVEIPITSFRASPLLFWRMAAAKRGGGARHRAFGGGVPSRHGSGYYLRRLFLPGRSVASVDGMKAGELGRALSRHQGVGDQGIFHVMGHPKSLSPYALRRLEEFFRTARWLEPATMRSFLHLRPERAG